MLARDNKADGSPEIQQLPEVKQRNTKRIIKTTVRHGSLGATVTAADRIGTRPDTAPLATGAWQAIDLSPR